MKTDIHLLYRPKTFDEVVGHKAEIRSLRDALENVTTHAFLLTGPSGVGKTTIARIIAAHVGCDPRNLMEIDAASNTGIDAMREVTVKMAYAGFGQSPKRVIVVDECHSLSAAAWQSLLKSVEEPPPHVYWVFCTTVPTKVPDTIRNRCHAYDFKAVKTGDIYDLLLSVVKQEEMTCPDDVVFAAAQAAKGSPRQGLTYLSQVSTCTTRKEAAAFLREPSEDSETIDLIRAIQSGKPWSDVVELLKPLKDINPESLRIQTALYFTKVLLGTNKDELAEKIFRRMIPFLEPYPQGATYANFVGSVADSVFA